MPVHLKGGIVLPGESLGNNLGAIVVRVPGEISRNNTMENDSTRNNSRNGDSQKRLLMIHNELYRIKNTPTALLSHIGAKMLSYTTGMIPISWASKIYALSNANSIAVISNNRASSQMVHMNGREVTNFYGFVPLPPGIPIGIVCMSYNGSMNCTITAQKWAVPDADQFLVWILEEYINLVHIAKQKHHQLETSKM
jgi:WS/DGAT C-terminal domain